MTKIQKQSLLQHLRYTLQKAVYGKQKEQGFTLIELLIVIAIIAILASIVIIAINPTANIETAQNTAATKQSRAIQNAIVQHIISHGSAPAGITTNLQVLCAPGFDVVDGCEINLEDELANQVDSDYSFIANIPVAANRDRLNLPEYDSGFRVSTDGTRYFVESAASSIAAAICLDGATYPIPVTFYLDSTPVLVGSNLYIPGGMMGGLAIVDTTTDTFDSLISLPSISDAVLIAIGTDLYVSMGGFPSGSIDVLDTTTNTVSTSISIPSNPGPAVLVGTDLYVTNVGANNVTVIDTTTNTITTNIATTHNPDGLPILIGNKLYIPNGINNTVTVINTFTNTLVTTIPVGSIASKVVAVGTDAYVFNTSSNTISVINTTTDTVSETIALGSQPSNGVLVGTDLYVSDEVSNTVTVIDTSDNSITTTIAPGSSPLTMFLVDNYLYVSNVDSNNLSVINTTTNTVVQTVNLGTGAYGNPAQLGNKLYYTDSSGEVFVLNTQDNTLCGA